MNGRQNGQRVGLIITLYLLTLCPGVSEAGLRDAHKQALATYRSNNDPGMSLQVLERAGAQSATVAKLTGMTDSQYVSFLNDYGFFLSETSDRWQEAIPVLEKVIALNPNRHVAHLNLGDVYAKASAASTDPSRQAELDGQVRSHYEDYARLALIQNSKGALPERVQAVLNRAKEVAGHRPPMPPSDQPAAHDETNGTGLQLHTTIKNIGLELPISFDGQHVIFSRYDKTGNAKELVFLNTRTGTIEETLGGLGFSFNHYLFSDEHYVITRDHGEPHRLIVFDRAKKTRLREVKFNQRITGAFVRDNRLHVVQVNNPYHLADGGQALTYDLGTGKLLSSAPVMPSNTTLLYGEQVILTGHEIKAYDLAFKELGGFPVPTKSRQLNGSCELGPAKVVGDKLLVGANCGDIAIYDLKKRTLERTIPAFDPAYFNSFDVVGDLLFVAPGPRDMRHSPNKGRIFDLQTGEEKSTLDIAAYSIAIDHDLLITVSELSQIQRQYNTLTIYRMQKDLLVAADTRLKKIRDAYENAKAFAARHDNYRAIDILEEAGFPAALASDGLDGPLESMAKDYTRWLADTFHRFAEALPLIAQFRLKYPQEASWALVLSDVLRKQYEIGGDKAAWDKSIAAYQEYQQLSGRALGTQQREFARDKQVIASSDVHEVSIVGGDIINSIFFHEERAYIGRYDCINSHGGVSLEVFERQTFQHLQTIHIAGCDDDYQDNIGNIRFTPTQILLDIGYRYESLDRPNLVVLDKASLANLDQSHRDLPDQNQETPPLEANDPIFTAAGIRNQGAETHYILHDVKTGQDLTLARLKPRLKDFPVMASYESFAFVGFGHDLLILDGFNKRIAHYERNFIPQDFEDNGHGLDTNHIDMLIVDGDRLIARTFYGHHSRILNLTALKKSLGFPTDKARPQHSDALTFTVDRLGSHMITLGKDIPLSTPTGGDRPTASPTLVQPEYVQAMARIAEVEAGMGNMQASKETLAKAWSAAQTLLNPREQIEAYVTLARTMAMVKETVLALTVIEQAESAIKQMSVASSLTTLTAWPKLAQVYALLPDGQYRIRASEWISRTRESLAAATDEEKVAILLRIAEVEHSLGHRQTAIETVRESIRRLPTDSITFETRARGLLDISAIQAALEGKGVAANTIRQAFEVARSISSKTTRVQMYAAVAAAQARLGDKKSSEISLGEAQKVGVTIKKDSNQDRVAAAVAKAKAALKQFDVAEKLLDSNHTGTWAYQQAFGDIAKDEARAGELDRAIAMALRYTTLSEAEQVHLVVSLVDVLNIALQAGVGREHVGQNLEAHIYPRLAKLQPFH
jgi:tetratricopeptide (TPR) repeat protein